MPCHAIVQQQHIITPQVGSGRVDTYTDRDGRPYIYNKYRYICISTCNRYIVSSDSLLNNKIDLPEKFRPL